MNTQKSQQRMSVEIYHQLSGRVWKDFIWKQSNSTFQTKMLPKLYEVWNEMDLWNKSVN